MNICFIFANVVVIIRLFCFRSWVSVCGGSGSHVGGFMGFCLFSSFLLLSTRYARYSIAM